MIEQKGLYKPEYVFYFGFFKVATFCFDDRFAHSWHSLNQIHEAVTWNGFQLTGVPFIYGISCLVNVFGTMSCVVQR